MFRNYLKIAWRNLWKSKTFSFVNITGLAVGIAGVLLITFHIRHELSYEKGFEKADRIYRVTYQSTDEDARHWAATAPPLVPALQRAFPQIEAGVRLHRLFPYQLFSYTNPGGEVKRFEEKGGFFANENVTEVFELPFAAGDPKSALKNANTIVLSEAMAKKYFGNADPMGKTIRDERAGIPLLVTGVVKALDFPSHFQFDYLVSMPTVERYINQRMMENTGWAGFYNYVLLREGTTQAQVEAALPAFAVKFFEPSGDSEQKILATRHLHLQPIRDIHLHSKLEKEMYPNSDITYIYIFAVAAIFILLVATVNFINISTALAFNRMKEIGLRKVVGGTRGQLLRQFLGESLLITLLSTAVAVLLFKIIIPYYTNVASGGFVFESMFTWANMGIVALLIIGIALLAGLYPAWFVARFNPVVSLKGKRLSGTTVNFVRKGLIVFQFTVSVFMIFGTMIVYRQMRLFHEQDLGFNKDQLVAVTMYDQMQEKYGVLADDMSKNSNIASFSIISTLPGERFGNYDASPLHRPEQNPLPENSRMLWSDEKFLTTLGIQLKDGRAFRKQFPEVKNHEFILNEAAVKVYRLKNPVGEAFVADGDTGTVVGVVKNFNFASLHGGVEPLVIQYIPFRSNYILVKVKGGSLPATIQFLESRVHALAPDAKFTYSFLDQNLDKLYVTENRMSKVFTGFAALSIFISCLGLFGLSAYSAKLRVKEVGVRKVLGASVGSVAFLLSRDFLLLVLIAIAVSLPLAWWAMDRWLGAFTYRITIGWEVPVVAALAALLLAVVTISFQAVKTALLNPVRNLRAD
ncbi:putative ABC transport system permease protein [Dyadobacter soli]|uniref:Putative ABC transport system permease protein n=1 Tax=Dyadobacter soli TaxID=659014 RepID=A0A1G6UMK0_9BACT|nr:ABC transporter permease [Dyadobacter soli]SDD42543.1 putative ABC transport system permease protein [Dyadobacter soli]